MEPFDLASCPLDGSHLIEASAGTGKTFTIAGLYLRFIVERRLKPDQVLVVTFTEAATKELRERIRRRLQEALDSLLGLGGADVQLSALLQKGIPEEEALSAVTDALRNVDEAAIYTIHGFCQRILSENAFESGCLFDTELITTQDDLRQEVIQDFWRRRFYDASSRLVHYLLFRDLTPRSLLDLTTDAMRHPGVRMIPEVSSSVESELIESLEALAGAVADLAATWPAARPEVASILLDPALNARSYGNTKNKEGDAGPSPREAKVEAILQAMDLYLAARNPECPLPIPRELNLLTVDKIAASVKKGGSVADHDLFRRCREVERHAAAVEAAGSSWLVLLKRQVIDTVHRELPRRKREKNVQHFDDLLLNLKEGLERTGGDALAARVRERFHAALIDEFQDTDAVQYAIFQNLFGDAGRSLFLIGDPKQAIYAFRGADVFAYMEASRRAEHRFTLPTNWRSEPELIQAVNTLFSSHPQPFIFPEIGFQPARAPEGKKTVPLILEGKRVPPLQLWFLERSRLPDTPRIINKGDATEWLLRAVASQASELLGSSARGEARLGSEPLQESDLAVLVRTNRQARLMQRALWDLSIPSVLYSTDDVFDSHEAGELECILTAMVESQREELLRGALLTDIMGGDGTLLVQTLGDDRSWEERIDAFHSYRHTWHDQGFIRMLRLFMLRERVQERLASFPDGERRLTNLLHLAELLHQAAVDRRLAPAELLRWFSHRRDPGQRLGEEQQLRLESDEKAVRIVTIHRSKGLEYPVVFCPFTWESSRLRSRGDSVLFHDEETDRALTVDFGSPKFSLHAGAAEREILSEDMRLLYVALTRARTCCHLYWGAFNTAESSALAYLLHSQGRIQSDDIVSETEAAFKALDDSAILDQLKAIEARSGGCVQLRLLSETPGSRYERADVVTESLQCRSFGGRIDRAWRVTSFSALTAGAYVEGEPADRDEADASPSPHTGVDEDGKPPEAGAGFFAFPRGTRAGVVLHEIFEKLDFQEPDPSSLRLLVGEKLSEYGFEPSWSEAVESMIRKTLALPLGHPGKVFSLADIPMSERLMELEFTFPIARLSPSLLRDVISRVHFGDSGASREPGDFGDAPPAIDFERLSFQPVRGFVKGFIDLIFRHGERFYLADWKSNHLGSSVQDYTPEALGRTMTADQYHLQYLLYTVALDRYLARRIPDYDYERHFGEVYYFFLRGIDPEVSPTAGLFRHRPSRELVDALGSALFGGRG